MEDDQWHDPLLITDASWQQNPNSLSQHSLLPLASVQVDTVMADPEAYSPNKSDNDCGLHLDSVISLQNRRSEAMSAEDLSEPIVNSIPSGRSILGFSLTWPDLVNCGESPDIPRMSMEHSPEFLKGASVQLSLEDGIDGSESTGAAANKSTIWGKSSNEDIYAESSFELPVLSINNNDNYSQTEAVLEDGIPFGKHESPELMERSNPLQWDSPQDNDKSTMRRDTENFQAEYDIQRRELNEAKQAVERLKRENEQKSRECQEAWNSLKELQNELMRKSMHVGSLAFAVEGQVKEKSRWFSSLRDLTRKLKLLKLDQIKLSEEAMLYKKCLEEMNQMSSMVQLKLNQQVELHEDLKTKFIKGAKERKDLYNKILELKGNIRVFCRCRPLNTEEIANGDSIAIDFDSAKDGELTVKSNQTTKKFFKFDAVFGPQANQVDVFEDTAPVATSVLDGYNVCIFAYGQTGSGKTFTMEGTDESRGVNFRTLDELFRIINDRKNQIRYEVCVSVLEVYNEQIRDLLLSESNPGTTAKRLEIRQVGEGSHHVPGLVEAHVSNMSQVWDVLQTGSQARAVGSTNANEHSSRSHCIHCVMVKGENLLNGERTKSKLWLVDLAGSERIAKTEVQGERLRETQNINRSLSALGDVISALATKSPHIPFRNSKLTHLLQDSLGGDSKTLMFVQVSPNENDVSETLCSLNFASRVRGIELGPVKKQFENNELSKYKQMVEKTKQEMKSKDVQIKRMEDTLHLLDTKMKEKESKNKNLQEKVKELESLLVIERKVARQQGDTKIGEDQTSPTTRPPLVARPLGGSQKYLNEVNISRALIENNKISTVPAEVSLMKHQSLAEKENNPEITEQLEPKRNGRTSLCPVLQKIPGSAIVPRRSSLIPLPPKFQQLQPLLVPIQAAADETFEMPELRGSRESPKELKKDAGKKLYGAFRKSLHKKIQMKSSPVIKRGGVNVGGVDRVRVSIGSRGRLIGGGGRGGFLGNNAKRVFNDVQPPTHKKGWNNATRS